MQLALNHNKPAIMHIDLNSCFATIEQQANSLLRGKPIAVAAYITPSGCVISPSIESKRLGVKVGMTVREAKLMCPGIVIRAPDPPKYRFVHTKFAKIFRDYSPDVVPKSIDEAVIDFTSMQGFYKRELTEIAREIKQRMRQEIGEWISCSIGISTNRFLAKTAASLQKPDGLEVIDHTCILQVYKQLSLIDLCGINTRYQARLNANGIFTPVDFLNASLQTLQKQVFQSINGYYWYLRLRGWEIDAVSFARKSFGQSYALQKHTENIKELAPLLMKLTEKMGRRLRKAGYAAKGIHVACIYRDFTHWHRGKTFDTELYTTYELFTKVMLVFNMQPVRKVIANLAVSCFQLVPASCLQENLFDRELEKKREVSRAMDTINDTYGEFVVTPALMMGLDREIIDRIAFGGVRELEDIYGE
jgi:DNA polymerase IV